MNTEKSKPIRKSWGQPGSHVTRKTEACVFDAGGRRPVVVSIYPDGLIGLRLFKRRREEFVFASDIYRQAVVARVAAARAAKKKGHQ
jgi:hypothetical protein